MTGIPERLRELVGREHDMDSVNWELKRYAHVIRAPVVGAYQISCSDESERECVESFHHIFVRELLPQLKYWSRSSFRTANLGGRYERGALAIAEEHFATPPSTNSFKLLVIKLNCHVSVVETKEGPLYGWMQRYERESVYCGAMHALLDGASGAFVDELAALFTSGGVDRLAKLRAMDESIRSLAAAITGARLQLARIIADIETIKQHSPTLYLVLAAVTLNRTQKDSEFLAAMCTADYRHDAPEIECIGLGDDPSRYRIEYERGRLLIQQR